MSLPKVVHLGADHAGFELKDHLRAWLADRGYDIVDHGTSSRDRVDYPDFAAAASRAVAAGNGEAWGLLVCGSGIGVSITANRFEGIRAVLAASEIQARLARAHNDANVVCLGARLTTPLHAESIVEAFLGSDFEGGRHQRRVQRIDEVAK